ncbi:DUF5317 family protein [Ferroacidibacillus organovorans]|uniref:DUF5317 domain-containing protein n=1 Tax=Ferroacidibacillus organovorans TaxID=1765683 RepID=A0A853KBR7_9BACL|nr:DUF5317 family protein [Ferroacidibacillus organovorans]KYP81184.1 hypothetical protein AYJ22_08505 [Ferroacidibacillus organovorans]OAG93848.1 hypothetical protein AYW79_08655 [Ferroacidibacillus organovorans]
MQLIVVGLAVIIAFLRGGRELILPNFVWKRLLLVAIGLQLISFVLPVLKVVLVDLSYAVALLFLYLNYKIVELRFALIGVAMNSLEIWLNRGAMPGVHVSGMDRLTVGLLNNHSQWHQFLTAKTVFPFLADIFYMSFPYKAIYSVGDFMIALSIGMLLQRVMGKPLFQENKRL